MITDMKLGDRMKNYEKSYRTFLPKNKFVILRFDGKNFSSYTKNLKKPFDERLIQAMNAAAIALCKNVQGSIFAYTQSDEITLLVTDLSSEKADYWFNGRIDKILSVGATIVTNAFNSKMMELFSQEILNNIPERFKGRSAIAYYIGKMQEFKSACFDARIALITEDKLEVLNNFLWRQQDWRRNSVSMASRSFMGHKQCLKKNTKELKEILKKTYNYSWDDLPQYLKDGTLIFKEYYEVGEGDSKTIRSKWMETPAEDFVDSREKYLEMISQKIFQTNFI